MIGSESATFPPVAWVQGLLCRANTSANILEMRWTSGNVWTWLRILEISQSSTGFYFGSSLSVSSSSWYFSFFINNIWLSYHQLQFSDVLVGRFIKDIFDKFRFRFSLKCFVLHKQSYVSQLPYNKNFPF